MKPTPTTLRRALWGLLLAFAITACDEEEPQTTDDTMVAEDMVEDSTTNDTNVADTGTPQDTGGTDTNTGDTGGAETDVSQPNPGNGEVAELELAAPAALDLPFDSALSPDGDIVYYVSTVDDVHQLFSIEGGNASQLSTGAGFTLPLGVATDGDQVFVLDTGWENPSDPEAPEGVIYTVALTGGDPAVITGTEGYAPTNADVVFEANGDKTLYFTGRDPSTGEPGVFSMSAAGGSVSTVSSGAPMVAPSGLAVLASGEIVVADPVAFDETGGLFKVDTSGNATELIAGLLLGQPAGLALSGDEAFVLVSALSATDETTIVHRVDVSTGAIANDYAPANIAGNTESGGLHCAENVERCVWSNAESGTGGVYIVYLNSNPKP